MIVIPHDKLEEWKYTYLQIARADRDQQSYIDYVAHCAAQWAYLQGMIDMQRLAEHDYH
jgi:hypothetical protein